MRPRQPDLVGAHQPTAGSFQPKPFWEFVIRPSKAAVKLWLRPACSLYLCGSWKKKLTKIMFLYVIPLLRNLEKVDNSAVPCPLAMAC